MSVTQLCPDDLLLAARSGNLSLQDEAKLSLHLQRCDRCRAALGVGRAFDTVLGAQAGDDAIASRIAAHVTGRPQRRWLGYALGGAFLLTGSLAAGAAGTGVLQRWLVDLPAPPAEPPSVAPPVETRPAPGSAVVPSAAVPMPEVAPPASATAPEPAPSPKRSAVSSDALPKSAASLFAEANALRGRGESAEARKLYVELQKRYPSATEAKVSLVSLARLELGAQPAQALRHFDAYLASGHTTLAEEALFGRASALGQLGRAAQERAAWRQLLDRYPSSVYAERAKARLRPAKDP